MSPHDEVNQLFDETILCLSKARGAHFREQQIFKEVLGDTPKMSATFLQFLHDVSTCPPEVIQWCQRQINANAHLRVVK